MFIIGVSFFYHDSAAVLLHDGKLVAAAEEERFSRKKHDHSFPINAIQFCLKEAGISSHGIHLLFRRRSARIVVPASQAMRHSSILKSIR